MLTTRKKKNHKYISVKNLLNPERNPSIVAGATISFTGASMPGITIICIKIILNTKSKTNIPKDRNKYFSLKTANLL